MAALFSVSLLALDVWVVMSWFNERITVSVDGWTYRRWNGRERFVKFSEFQRVDEGPYEGVLAPTFVWLSDGSRINIPASIQSYKQLRREAEVRAAANRGIELLP